MDTLHALLDARFGIVPTAAPDAALPPELAQVLSRRTCRSYRPDAIPGPLLESLLACAQSAPSKSDLQQYAIIVVEEPAAKAEIAGWLPRMPWIAEAPTFLVFCADVRRNRRVCEWQGRPHANDNVDTFLNATVDAALAMGTFIVAAEAAGLGTCPISYVRNHLPGMVELLGLPAGVFPIAGLCVGFPAQAAAVSMRLPPQVVVHRNRYDDSALESELAAYDARRHARQPIAAEKQKNAATYGTSDRCTWSDQVSRQLSLAERADFRTFLHNHGFALD